MKNKFKPGDLVTLSAAGEKTAQNEECRGGFGFIKAVWLVAHGRPSAHKYPIRTKWWTKDLRVIENMNFKPYELKFYKK